MHRNIGIKIQGLAVILGALNVLGCFVSGIVLWVLEENPIFCLIIFLGPIGCLIMYLFIYGFGLIVECSETYLKDSEEYSGDSEKRRHYRLLRKKENVIVLSDEKEDAPVVLSEEEIIIEPTEEKQVVKIEEDEKGFLKNKYGLSIFKCNCKLCGKENVYGMKLPSIFLPEKAGLSGETPICVSCIVKFGNKSEFLSSEQIQYLFELDKAL